MTLLKAAEVVFKQNMAVKQGESVLIVTDEGMRDIAQAFYDVGLQLGYNTSIIEMKVGKVDGEEPPRSIAGAISMVS